MCLYIPQIHKLLCGRGSNPSDATWVNQNFWMWAEVPLQAGLKLTMTSRGTSRQPMTKSRVRAAPGDFDSECQTKAFWGKDGSQRKPTSLWASLQIKCCMCSGQTLLRTSYHLGIGWLLDFAGWTSSFLNKEPKWSVNTNGKGTW